MRAYVYDTARATDLSMAGNRLDSDGVKLFGTTAAKNIADRAIQVMGGYGYVGEYTDYPYGAGTCLEEAQKYAVKQTNKGEHALWAATYDKTYYTHGWKSHHAYAACRLTKNPTYDAAKKQHYGTWIFKTVPSEGLSVDEI